MNFDYAMADGRCARLTSASTARTWPRAQMLLRGPRPTPKARSRPHCSSIEAEHGPVPHAGGLRGLFRRRGCAAPCWNITAGTRPRCASARTLPTSRAVKETDRATYQAMEALIHNLNTMHSRAGAQTPFSSINYGMDTSPEGRMVMKNVLLATEAGLGQRRDAHLPHPDLPGERGRELQPRRPELRPVQAGHAAVSAKRLFPNFSFIDAPVQPAVLQGGPSGDGDRLHGLPHPRDRQRRTIPTARSANGRGNLSFTSINLPAAGHQGQGGHRLLLREPRPR